jgi:hypothetical protein
VTHVFRPGDRALLIKSKRGVNTGLPTTVVSHARECSCCAMVIHDIVMDDGRNYHCPPAWLEPYRPDHSERGEWTEELLRLCGVKVEEEA